MTLTPLMLFAGSRVDAGFEFTGSQFPYLDTGGTAYDPAYADAGVGLPNGAAQALCRARNAAGALVSVGAGHTFYSHAQWSSSRGPVTFGYPTVELLDASDVPWLRLIVPNGDGIHHLQRWTGSAWVDVATCPSINYAPLDLAVTVDAGGNHNVLWAVSNSTIFNGVVPISGMSNLAAARWYAIDNGGSTVISEVMLSQDVPLVGAHLKTIRATGAGAYSDWSGSASDVNEAATNDATSNKTSTVGAKQSYAMGDVTLPAGYSLKGLFYRIRARNDGTNSPLNVKPLLRVGSTDYVGADLGGVSPAYGYQGLRYDVDPSTGVAWTLSAINGMELGFVASA